MGEVPAAQRGSIDAVCAGLRDAGEIVASGLRAPGLSVDHRGELDDRPAAHELDHPAVMLSQKRVDHLAAQLSDRGQGGGLVLFD